MAMTRAFQWPDWEYEEYPSKEDVPMAFLFALLFPILRLLLDRLILESLGRWLVLGSTKGSQEDVRADHKKRHTKFKESAWKCLYYFSAESLALAVTHNEPWFTNTHSFWVGPGDQMWPDQKVKTKLKLLYMYAAGFYTYSIFALIFWETRRLDFGVTMSHHVATVILILASYLLRFSRVGSIVLAIHDASDVLLEISKMFKYSGSTVIPSIAFILFAISWVVLRLIYFPFWIIWSTRAYYISSVLQNEAGGMIKGETNLMNAAIGKHWMVDCHDFMNSYEVLLTLDTDKHKIEGPIYYYIFNSLLICLLVLHIYWWVLIYRMVVRQIKEKGKISEDLRSDSESEDKEE